VYFCSVLDGEPVGGDSSTKPGGKKTLKALTYVAQWQSRFIQCARSAGVQSFKPQGISDITMFENQHFTLGLSLSVLTQTNSIISKSYNVAAHFMISLYREA